MSVENQILAAAELPPKEMYAVLCEIKQEAAENNIDYLAAKISGKLRQEKIRKPPHLLYSMVETLRIAAPYNPFTPEMLRDLFKQLIQRGPRRPEEKKALEIIASYRMVTLVSDVKIVNALAELALLNISHAWSGDMLQSIVEEKEEDLGKEIKAKIVKRVAEGSSTLGVFISNYPLLFMPAVNELILSSKRSKTELIKRFNSLNKEVITVELIEKAIETSQEKKEFLKFVREASVRHEVIKYLETLEEDRSAWVRCEIPVILYKKAQSPFYTTAIARSIRISGISAWKKRLQDASASVRQDMLRAADQEDIITHLPELMEDIIERTRDISVEVRKEALGILAKTYAGEMHRDMLASSEVPCFVCRKKETDGILVSTLLSIFIQDHAVQLDMVKGFFKRLTSDALKVEDRIPQAILLEIYQAVVKQPEDIETLIGCAAALNLLGITLSYDKDPCDAHKKTIDLIRISLSIGDTDAKAVVEERSPPCLVVMLCEKYPKGLIPKELLVFLKSLTKAVGIDLFCRIARIITVAQYNTGLGWGTLEEYAEHGTPREYLEIKQMCTTEGGDFSIDLSRVEDRSLLAGSEVSIDIQQQERKLNECNTKILLMVQMDLLECCIRSAILERTVFKYLLSQPYSAHTYFENSLFFKQRLAIGIRSHPDTEIRLLFSVISVLICQQTSLSLNSKGILSVLSLLCWLSIEYTHTRTVEVVFSLFRANIPLAQDFFSFFMNLKRVAIEDTVRQTELYILSEDVSAMLVRETSKLNINSAQYSNELPSGFCEELRLRGGWAATLLLLDDDRFSSNLLTVFKPKAK
ncbi:hypothetical protein NEPAR06_0777 [Nematocida parisii]|uniref:Uncharacterized protein n=1 Tax=Nematocida parisii (strain ERTm3) TaxID=935791 RepID=I3EJ82_NEMP3|nr:uncharacterized protein NEPG_02517 [Nematocida parisii ERTm1]EIJ89279.1 hypothetical protein NEQG_00049 [Nematocida parisii ERTm3]KAI5143642.1 hypothetical protein NEPAR07_0742 [Nematocida parisii]EIJ92629.1 hypothetical protein NEPG_02517 [Nematocida parisii ERTm1]KAI5153989.1 hypothetical protein NEPAR06_0777 [Nematocida parisii]KAI5155904.1 hypothetical protein NEPAR05_0153 [Nematocida parisii]|eukprot:XP_013060344.1 hypothetical protein NEPG_02517 [Nematocida parisii ERTm1]